MLVSGRVGTSHDQSFIVPLFPAAVSDLIISSGGFVVSICVWLIASTFGSTEVVKDATKKKGEVEKDYLKTQVFP